jgi:imidazolonepropionase-like amidohydrolase
MRRKNTLKWAMLRLLAAMAVPLVLNAADDIVVLKAAHMFDGRADHVVSPGLVVVAGAKILAVGRGAAIPAGAQTIDLGDATLLPGFIDAHTHLSSLFHNNYLQGEQDWLKKPVAERALLASETV